MANETEFSIRHVAKFILIVMGVVDLFGQMFVNTFSYVATGVALSAFFAVYLSGKTSGNSSHLAYLVLLLCILGVTGVSYGIYEYYSNHQVAGNSYPTAISIALIGSFVVLAFYKPRRKDA